MTTSLDPVLIQFATVKTGSKRLLLLRGLFVLLALVVISIAFRTYFRYSTADVMHPDVREFSNAEYPENPANHSVHHGRYNDRKLTLVKRDETHFDFILESDQPHVAKIAFRNVDVSLMTPGIPEWAKNDSGLQRIALTDRQWNRQQVNFGGLDSPSVEITGGDGFEAKNLFSAELAKNCLNAGLWEILLFTNENNSKTLYYQGWFTFPLGHYRDLFEHNTGLSYHDHWYYLEHWFDPEGTPVSLTGLRKVVNEKAVTARFDKSEPIIAAGEQIRKRKTTLGENLVSWNDIYKRSIAFASFIPPGRYSVSHEWNQKYSKMRQFDRAVLRTVETPTTPAPLTELELVFSDPETKDVYRFFASGFDPDNLPQLSMNQYHNGLYMPMGIGIPPFMQGYGDLQKVPPYKSPYFSVLLDKDDRWIDHHAFALDGAVMHRDQDNADLLHVYLLSYERHTLVAHVIIPLG